MKNIFGLRLLSLTSLCGLLLSAQAQDCNSNLGSTTFKPSGEASTWQYCSVQDVSTEGPAGVKISAGLSAPDDLEDFTSATTEVSAVATNSFKLNAVAADPTLVSGTDYDPDELYFADVAGSMLVTKFTGTTQLFEMAVPNVKAGSEFEVEYTLCNVVNPNSPEFQATLPSYMMQNPGWESSVKIEGIKVGTNYSINNHSCGDGKDYFGTAGSALTMADEGCKTYKFKGKATSDNFTFHIYSYYPNTPIPIGIKDVKVTGCFSPKIKTSDLTPCRGEQIPLSLDRNYNATSYKWERSINGGPWETISTSVSAFDESDVNDESKSKYQYRCIVDGQESNIVTIEPKTCCVVDGKPASQKKVFYEDFGYFTDYYTYVDKNGDVSTVDFAYRANTSFEIPKHDYDDGSNTPGPISKVVRGGSVQDGTYAVLVPSPIGPTVQPVYNADGGTAKYFAGVTSDNTSLTTGQSNSACLFINVAPSYKGVIFENKIPGLCKNKNLTFECYIANMSDASPPVVTISLLSADGNSVLKDASGKELKVEMTAEISSGWNKVSLPDILLDEETVIIQIESNGENWSSGNDLAIDDIKFLTCAPPQIAAYYSEETLSTDTVLCSDNLEVVMPETDLLKNYFGGKQRYVLQYSLNKKEWFHLSLSDVNKFNFKSDEVVDPFTVNGVKPEKVYMRVIVASEATAKTFVTAPN